MNTPWSPMSLDHLITMENTWEKMPPPTCDVSWRIFEHNTNARKLTAVRSTMNTDAGSSPNSKLFCSDAIKVGNANHDAMDIESTTIASTADAKKPLHIMPDRSLSGSMMSMGSLERVYAQTIKLLWAPNVKEARRTHWERTRLLLQSNTINDARVTIPIKYRTERRVFCFRRNSFSSRSFFFCLLRMKGSIVEPLPFAFWPRGGFVLSTPPTSVSTPFASSDLR
mmetsp:Transcript_23755/g.50866  ORF Transcript_23755/g.50866 Transcript_23755/m.50866 type:complete len:225 (-) Transcript_23755:122-796(-)